MKIGADNGAIVDGTRTEWTLTEFDEDVFVLFEGGGEVALVEDEDSVFDLVVGVGADYGRQSGDDEDGQLPRDHVACCLREG